MKLYRDLLAIVLLAVSSTPSWCQVVQLPTRRTFGVGTTVSVPDRGQAFLGGVNRSRSASTYSGLPVLGRLSGVGGAFRSRAFTRSVGSSQAQVSVTIIDLDAMDQAVLSQATPASTQDAREAWIIQKAALLSRHVDRNVTTTQKLRRLSGRRDRF